MAHFMYCGDSLRRLYDDETDNREPFTDVVDIGKSDRIDDPVDDLVVRLSNRTVSSPIRFGIQYNMILSYLERGILQGI